MALEAAAEHFTPDVLTAALHDLEQVERGFRVAQNELERVAAARSFLEVDRGFHRMVADLAGNSRLKGMLEGLWAQIAVFQNAGSFRDQWTDLAIARHRDVIASLVAGRNDVAIAQLRVHILEVKLLAIGDLTAEESIVSNASRRSGKRRVNATQEAA